MLKPIMLNIAIEFSDTPDARLKENGKSSAEQFREQILEKKFLTARDNKTSLVINLDGAAGYGTSFLEESFGGLARKYSTNEVLKTLQFISNDEPYLIEDIVRYIEEANLEFA